MQHARNRRCFAQSLDWVTSQSRCVPRGAFLVPLFSLLCIVSGCTSFICGASFTQHACMYVQAQRCDVISSNLLHTGYFADFIHFGANREITSAGSTHMHITSVDVLTTVNSSVVVLLFAISALSSCNFDQVISYRCPAQAGINDMHRRMTRSFIVLSPVSGTRVFS